MSRLYIGYIYIYIFFLSVNNFSLVWILLCSLISVEVFWWTISSYQCVGHFFPLQFAMTKKCRRNANTRTIQRFLLFMTDVFFFKLQLGQIKNNCRDVKPSPNTSISTFYPWHNFSKIYFGEFSRSTQLYEIFQFYIDPHFVIFYIFFYRCFKFKCMLKFMFIVFRSQRFIVVYRYKSHLSNFPLITVTNGAKIVVFFYSLMYHTQRFR